MSAVLAAQLTIQQRLHRLQVLPIFIIYLNNICDSRCQTCAIWKNNEFLKDAAKRNMPDGLLNELYAAMGEWQPRQILVSGGEPALHPRFAEVISRFATLAPKVCVITNGLLLSSLDRNALEKVAEFYISFDAPDRESYQTIRGVDGFDRLAASIQSLNSLTRKPVIVARCTLQRDNVRGIPELIGAAKRMGFQSISFLAVDVNSAAFSRDVHGASDAAGLQPKAGDLRAMSEDINSLAKSDESFVEGGIPKLKRILQYFRALDGDGEFPAVRCNAPWASVVVETTGQIRGCFFQPVIGDFRTINGDEAVRFRRALKVASDATCRRCVCSKWLGARDVMRMVD